jgi:hypothetical protein
MKNVSICSGIVTLMPMSRKTLVPKDNKTNLKLGERFGI